MAKANNREYRRDLLTGILAHQEEKSLVIDEVDFLPREIDYADREIVKILAESAVSTADGFYDLVERSCNTNNPYINHEPYLEMYLALSGFTCEIYMKAIIYYENLHKGKQIREHDLYILFGSTVFELMEELRVIAHMHSQKRTGAIKVSNGDLRFQ